MFGVSCFVVCFFSLLWFVVQVNLSNELNRIQLGKLKQARHRLAKRVMLGECHSIAIHYPV